MINVTLSVLVVDKMYRELITVYTSLYESLSNLQVPLNTLKLPLSTNDNKFFFQYFQHYVDHFGSADSFYSAWIVLNNFMSTYEYFKDNKIEFTSFNVSSESVLILDSFKIFKGVE